MYLKKPISILIAVSFLFTNISFSYSQSFSLKEDKLSPPSYFRFKEYLRKQELNRTNFPKNIDAMQLAQAVLELNTAARTTGVTSALIEDLNQRLRQYNIEIISPNLKTERITVKTGKVKKTVTLKYLTFKFGEYEERRLYLLVDRSYPPDHPIYEKLRIRTEQDRSYLEIPGVEGAWFTDNTQVGRLGLAHRLGAALLSGIMLSACIVGGIDFSNTDFFGTVAVAPYSNTAPTFLDSQKPVGNSSGESEIKIYTDTDNILYREDIASTGVYFKFLDDKPVSVTHRVKKTNLLTTNHLRILAKTEGELRGNFELILKSSSGKSVNFNVTGLSNTKGVVDVPIGEYYREKWANGASDGTNMSYIEDIVGVTYIFHPETLSHSTGYIIFSGIYLYTSSDTTQPDGSVDGGSVIAPDGGEEGDGGTDVEPDAGEPDAGIVPDAGDAGHENLPPTAVISIMPGETVNENTLVTLNGSQSSDPEEFGLTYEWEQIEGPEIDIINADKSTAQFIAPSVDQDTIIKIRLTVIDPEGLDDTMEVQFTVKNLETQNRPPEFTPIADQIGNENQEIEFTVEANDPEGGQVSLQAISLPQGASFDPITGEFSWTPTYNQANTYSAIFAAQDPENMASTLMVRITINNTNRQPIADARVSQSTVRERTTVTLNGTNSGDPDSEDTLTYNWTQVRNGSPIVTIRNPDQSTTTFVAPDVPDNETRVLAFQLIVTDNEGAESQPASIDITVQDIRVTNRPPEINNIGPQSINENQELQFTVRATDPDNDTITLSATSIPNGASFNPATGIFRWTPTYDQAAQYTITFKAEDPYGATATKYVTISVNNIDRPPVFSPINDMVTNFGERLFFVVTATDPDGDPITLSITSAPQGTVFNPQTGEFSWTPRLSQVGQYTIRFDARAGDTTISTNVDVTVNNDYYTAASQQSTVAPDYTSTPFTPYTSPDINASVTSTPEGTLMLNYTMAPGNVGRYAGVELAAYTVENVALESAGSTATASSFYRMGAEGFTQAPSMAIDGRMNTVWSCDGPTEYTYTQRYPATPWFQVDFRAANNITSLRLHGKNGENILSGDLTFSDGSTLGITEPLDVTGQGTNISLSPEKQNITSIRLQATNSIGENPGLVEFEALGNVPHTSLPPILHFNARGNSPFILRLIDNEGNDLNILVRDLDPVQFQGRAITRSEAILGNPSFDPDNIRAYRIIVLDTLLPGDIGQPYNGWIEIQGLFKPAIGTRMEYATTDPDLEPEIYKELEKTIESIEERETLSSERGIPIIGVKRWSNLSSDGLNFIAGEKSISAFTYYGPTGRPIAIFIPHPDLIKAQLALTDTSIMENIKTAAGIRNSIILGHELDEINGLSHAEAVLNEYINNIDGLNIADIITILLKTLTEPQNKITEINNDFHLRFITALLEQGMILTKDTYTKITHQLIDPNIQAPDFSYLKQGEFTHISSEKAAIPVEELQDELGFNELIRLLQDAGFKQTLEQQKIQKTIYVDLSRFFIENDSLSNAVLLDYEYAKRLITLITLIQQDPILKQYIKLTGITEKSIDDVLIAQLVKILREHLPEEVFSIQYSIDFINYYGRTVTDGNADHTVSILSQANLNRIKDTSRLKIIVPSLLKYNNMTAATGWEFYYALKGLGLKRDEFVDLIYATAEAILKELESKDYINEKDKNEILSGIREKGIGFIPAYFNPILYYKSIENHIAILTAA